MCKVCILRKNYFFLQKYRNEFNTNLALTEVYKYAKKYRSQVSLSSCRSRHCPVRVWACRWTDGSSFLLWIELVWHERAITWGLAKQCWWLWMCSVHFTAWVWRRRLVFGFSGTFLSVVIFFIYLFFCILQSKQGKEHHMCSFWSLKTLTEPMRSNGHLYTVSDGLQKQRDTVLQFCRSPCFRSIENMILNSDSTQSWVWLGLSELEYYNTAILCFSYYILKSFLIFGHVWGCASVASMAFYWFHS